MKSNAIIRIIIWSLVLVILMSILGSFLAYDRFSFRRSTEYSPAETDFPVPLEETIEEEVPVQALPNEETLTLIPGSVREIEIEWVAGDIIIQPIDTDVISISESDVSDSKYQMVWKEKNQKLEIHFCEETLISGFGIKFDSEVNKDLYIYVPREWVCDSLEIDAASATVEINDLTIHSVDIDGASGTCDFENCHLVDLDIDTASGDVTFSGSLDTLDFDAASASFVGDFTNTPSRIDMDGMSGSLDIALPDNCGYTLSVDGMSSTFRSDFQGTEMKNNSHVYGDGRCRINVDGMSCDVTIRKGAVTSLPGEATLAPTQESTTP